MQMKQSLKNLSQSIDNLELTIGWLKEAKTEKQIEMLIKNFEECGQSLRADYEKLKNISTKELAEVLENMEGVQVFQDRLYQAGYNINITHKYSEDRTPVELPSDITVLVIEN